MPDAAGLRAATQALALADGGGSNELVLVLISGGASANWIAPADGVTFEDKQWVTRALLRSGPQPIQTAASHYIFRIPS